LGQNSVAFLAVFLLTAIQSIVCNAAMHHMIMTGVVCVIVTSQQLQQQPVATAPAAPPYTFSPPQTELQKY